MGIFSSIVGALAPKLLGNLFGRKSSKPGYVVPDFVALRDAAIQGGFNPLTALNATGGGTVVNSEPRLSSAQFLAEALGEGISLWSNREERERDKEYETLRNTMMREEIAQLKKANADPFAQAGFGNVVTGRAPENEEAVPPVLRPRPRPGIDNVDRIPAMLPDGQMRKIPKSAADRLGIEPWGYITAGDYAELVGEVRGEGETALMADKIGQAVGIPVTGGVPKRDRLKQAPKIKEGFKPPIWGFD